MDSYTITEYSPVDGSFFLIHQNGRMMAKTWNRPDAERIVAALEGGQWIDVRSKQPEKHEWVLFIARACGDWQHYNNKVFAGRFQNYSEKYGGEFSMPGFGIAGTHWLPLSILPKPPVDTAHRKVAP